LSTSNAELDKLSFHKLHYFKETGPPKGTSQRTNFISELVSICDFTSERLNNVVITDRDIYGEMVYGPLYRKEDPNWIWHLEYKFLKLTNESLFILLEDSAKNTLKRDDGESFTTSRFKRFREILKFRRAFKKSIIPHKLRINLKNKTADDIAEEISTLVNVHLGDNNAVS